MGMHSIVIIDSSAIKNFCFLLDYLRRRLVLHRILHVWQMQHLYGCTEVKLQCSLVVVVVLFYVFAYIVLPKDKILLRIRYC